MKKKILILLTLILTLSTMMFVGCNNTVDNGKGDLPTEPTEQMSFVQQTYSVDRYSILTLDLKDAEDGAITWQTSDEKVALIDSGVVFGISQGACTITATVGEKSATCTLVVTATDSFMNLNLSQQTAELSVGAKKTLGVTLTDNNGKVIPTVFYKLSYESSNDLVSVENGVITANAVGTSTVLVKADCAGKTIVKTVEVTVKEQLNLSFDKTSINLFANSLKGQKQTSEQLVVFAYENGAKVLNPQITYRVNDTSIATVDENGVVTAVTQGTTTAYAEYVSKAGTSVTATLTVNVKYPIINSNERLNLEVFADENTVVDLSIYDEYFEGGMTDISVVDDLNNVIRANILEANVTLDNGDLAYGFRTLNFIVNGQIQFAYEAEIVTKIITTPEQLAEFAVRYGGRDENGCYEGYFVLGSNIDMTGYAVDFYVGNDGAIYQVTRDDLGFKGIFDGKGYTIYNASTNIFGRVSKDGVVKNVGFFSHNPIPNGAVSVLFAGTLENVYIRSDLSRQDTSHYSSIAYRAVGSPIIKNVVVDVVGINNVVESSFMYDCLSFNPTCENVYLITPNLDDPIIYKNGSYLGNIVHYAQNSQNKDFALIDKSSGYWQKDLDEYQFITSAYYDLDPVDAPDVSTFSVDANGTLTWGAVENADGYVLLINNTEVVTVATNSYPNFVQGAVQIVAKGNGIAHRNSAYSQVYSHFSLNGFYLADFAFNGYTALVDRCLDEHASAPTSVEVLDEFEGETNVLKVSMTSSAISRTGFTLKLPKDPGNAKVQVKMYNQCSVGQGLKFVKPGTVSDGLTGDIASATKNKWTTQSLDYTGLDKTDEVVIYTWTGSGKQDVVIYLSWVKSIDLAGSLEEGYVADFSSEEYAELLTSYNGYCEPKGTYIESFEGEENVLKIEMVSNTPNGNAGFRLALPKEVGSNKIQIKIYDVCSVGQGAKFMKPGTTELLKTETLVKNAWKVYELDYTGLEKTDEIALYTWTNGANTPVTVYLSWIKIV